MKYQPGREERTPKPGSSRFVVSDAPGFPSGIIGGENMTEKPTPTISVQDVPDPVQELRNMLKEQQAVIVKQNEAIKSLTARLNENEKLAAAAPAPSVQAAPAEPAPSPQDIAYEAMLKEFGIKEE